MGICSLTVVCFVLLVGLFCGFFERDMLGNFDPKYILKHCLFRDGESCAGTAVPQTAHTGADGLGGRRSLKHVQKSCLFSPC